MTNLELSEKAKQTRKEVFKFKTSSGFGHLASCLSCVDIVTSMYYDKNIEFDPKHDYLIFSKAHGSPAVYPILADLNFFDRSELDKYCRPGGILRLHADGSIPGCHCVGGSLGNGIGYAAGLAKANPSKKVFVVLGDAELYEGSVWESMIFIAHHNLYNIKILIDNNKIQSFGRTKEILNINYKKVFASLNYITEEVNGHFVKDILKKINKKRKYPLFLICNTIKGRGLKNTEDKLESHYYPASTDDLL